VVDVKSGKRSAVAVPKHCQLRDESPDGKRFLSLETTLEKSADGRLRNRPRSFLTVPGIKPEHSQLAPELGELGGISFSPDGLKVLAVRPIDDRIGLLYELLTVDIKSGAINRLNIVPDEVCLGTACWSPDGKQVAYAWFELGPAPPGAAPGPKPVPAQPPGAGQAQVLRATHVTVTDAKGKSRELIHTEVGVRIMAIDWR
jgi:Tol biopolymer transport system component